ncbi:beta-1,4-N-acetylgalactosaminyltransferase bre-4-like [Saccostrea echinata]|uniref:beta-1,4-N-acetylgalactosaminyltransferase bre-4-like n=1 Tax=Saccostrea echinata TaxID=191078 RepID=UPI002A7F0E51|nr:beta-1,4-N-acetylgalactosaminyltransferase bre-4-like [Saccostrea echinata]
MVVNGSHRPGHCTSRSKVAILIPYRDRDSHLRIFLNNMHTFLMKQQLDYGIYVVELDKDIPFNRGFLFNVGFMEASSDYDFDCFIFHDVDLLPMNDLNLYSCPDQPRHMSVAIDKYKYKLLYPKNFGGVSSLTKEQFTAVNGFSNWFFDWGGEDDDLYNRIVSSKMTISRVMSDVARYTMLSHKQAVANPQRGTILKTGKQRMENDGLNSLHYKIVEKTHRKLFVHIKVSIDPKELTNFVQNIQTFVKNHTPSNTSSKSHQKLRRFSKIKGRVKFK